VSFSKEGHLAWIPPVVCDGDGNVFLIPVPSADKRDLKRSPGRARFTKKPNDILKVSPDGRSTLVIEPASAPVLRNADTVSMGTLALGPNGSVLAVVRAITGEEGHQYILSFDSKGRYSSHVEVPTDEVFVHRVELLSSGEYFIAGTRLGEGPRAVIMGSAGTWFRDVDLYATDEDAVPASPEPTDPSQSRPSKPKRARMPDLFARGEDSRIYFLPRGEKAHVVHTIESTGDSRAAFELETVASGGQLVDMKSAGSRLVAIYYEELPKHRASFWFDVYDTMLGQRVALYGPASAIPVCFATKDGRDSFTLLKGTTLITMSP
jgi:hypothetical protein